MSTTRLDPCTLIFGELAAEHFPRIKAALGERSDRLDDFLLVAPALELLRLLRPDEGLGETVDDFVGFVHASYAFWAAGSRIVPCDEARTRALCTADPLPDGPITATGPVRYIQVAPRLIWGRLADEQTYEPLDGWFLMPAGSALRTVACFGVHPDRPGLSVVVAEGARPERPGRTDGSPLFAPTMPGGDAAGLAAVATPDELLLLAWRQLGEGDGD